MAALQLNLLNPRWAATMEAAPARLPYVDPFFAAHRVRLAAAADAPLAFDEDGWDHDARTACGFDIEVYSNFFVACFLRFSDGKRIAFELSERRSLNIAGLRAAIERNLIVTFNGTTYDLPIVYMALSGADTSILKRASDAIILGNERKLDPAKFGYGRAAVPRTLNHIDLMGVNPSVGGSLKALNARLHGRYVVDLPYAPETRLGPRAMNVVTLYCFNDLDSTKLTYSACLEPVKLRHSLGQRHGLELRGKSDAQVGEAIVLSKVERALGHRLRKPEIRSLGFDYNPPEFLKFEGEVLQKLLLQLAQIRFYVNAGGDIEAPPILKGLTVKLGAGTYAMGIGGLHSTEEHRALVSDATHQLIDVDVASQYPNIILKLGLYPEACGPAFGEVYGGLVTERLAAKAKIKETDDKIKELGATPKLKKEREYWQMVTDGGRVGVNGVYGKLGSPYSALYAPHLVVATTLTGQLSILMLIEVAELAGIPVVSANTDGVVFRCPASRAGVLDAIIVDWEARTGMAVERTPYRALYSSSVNVYVAVKEDGKVKRKGFLADPWEEGDLRGQMMKNPQMTVCSRAIVKYLTEGVPIERTVRDCSDPRAFVTVIKVSTGAVWRGHALGRCVRYFWSLDGDPVTYANSGRRVAKTEGARPLPELTTEMPPAVDYLRYCEEAARLATDLGIKL